MKRLERLERQRALIIKHHLRRCKRTGSWPVEGFRLPRLVSMYAKVWRKLIQTGAVEVMLPIPFGLRKRVLLADEDRGAVLLMRKHARMIETMSHYARMLASRA